MTDLTDALTAKAAQIVGHMMILRTSPTEIARAVLDAVADDLTRQAVAENERKWLEWSNELALLIPDGDESTYANPEGAQESIILDCFRAYMKEQQAVADALAPIKALADEWEGSGITTVQPSKVSRQASAELRAAIARAERSQS